LNTSREHFVAKKTLHNRKFVAGEIII